MKKQWQHSVLVDAPVDELYKLVSEFDHHPEWDRFTRKIERMDGGTGNGVGSEWKVYEQLGLYSLGEEEREPRHSTGLAKRVVREAVVNERVAWHTHPIPNIGISADMVFEFASEGAGTRVTQTATVSVPGVVEKVGRLIVRNLDERQQGQWRASLEKLKAIAEQARVPSAVGA